MKMSKLTEFYNHRDALLEQGQTVDPQWEHLEEQLLKEELLPELLQQMKSVLSKVKSPLMFSGNYDPNGCLSISFTRNCMQVSMPLGLTESTDNTESLISGNETQVVVNADEERDAVGEEESDNQVVRSTKSKSIGFSVSFRDGTVYHQRKAVQTWILALKKIGLENICNNKGRHRAWHRVSGQDICIVERTETVRKSDGKSPQVFIDGFYVMVQISNDQKVNDLQNLAKYFPNMGITVQWDNETEESVPVMETEAIIPTEAPIIDRTLPLKEQFRAFLATKKSISTANGYTSTLDNFVREWINKEVDSKADSVFSYTTPEDVRICIEMLNASPAFVEENDRKHHSMSAALTQYLLFVESL